MQPAEHRTGKQRLRIHDLRHSFASELLSRGVSPLAVSRILGHASASFTLDRYGHLMPRDFDAAVEFYTQTKTAYSWA